MKDRATNDDTETAGFTSHQPVCRAAASGWICVSAQDWWYHNRAYHDSQLMRPVAKHRLVLFMTMFKLCDAMRSMCGGFSTR